MGGLPTSGSDKFDGLRDYLATTPAARIELESALNVMLRRANPSDRGARFIVGSAVEWFVAATAWSAGVLTSPGGHNANGFDLRDLQDDVKGLWSVKSSFQPGRSPWRISNGLGGPGAGFVEPTVFVHRRLGGLVYIDPALHPDIVSKTTETGDAVLLPFRVVEDFAANTPSCVAKVDVPVNEGNAAPEEYAFVKNLLTPEHYPILSGVFKAATPRKADSVVEAVERLTQMKADGRLSDDQFADVLRAVLPD